MSERRLIAVAIPSQELAELLMHNTHIMHEVPYPETRPFPDGTRYVRTFHDTETDQIVLVYEHPSFYRTPAGAHTMRVKLALPERPHLIEGSAEDA